MHCGKNQHFDSFLPTIYGRTTFWFTKCSSELLYTELRPSVGFNKVVISAFIYVLSAHRWNVGTFFCARFIWCTCVCSISIPTRNALHTTPAIDESAEKKATIRNTLITVRYGAKKACFCSHVWMVAPHVRVRQIVAQSRDKIKSEYTKPLL